MTREDYDFSRVGAAIVVLIILLVTLLIKSTVRYQLLSGGSDLILAKMYRVHTSFFGGSDGIFSIL